MITSPFLRVSVILLLTFACGSYCSSSAAEIQILVGDRMKAEGGNWNPDQSPLKEPFGIDFDSKGSMYIVELTSGRLLKRDPQGKLTELCAKKPKGYAGDGGPVAEAVFNGPHNCVMAADDQLLIADTWNHVVRQVDLETLIVTTRIGKGGSGAFAGEGTDSRAASFHDIMSIELNPEKTILHLADLKNRRIRNVDLKTGIVTTLCGNGKNGVPQDGSVASQAPLVDPRGACSDHRGNTYILERGGNALRVVRSDGSVHTVAGTGKKGFRDGDALQAQFGSPKHICCDPAGNVLIADDLNGAIRQYNPETRQVTTLLGQGHGDKTITLLHPHGVRCHEGKLYILDTYNNRIFVMPH
ncbi:MAG: hypothetical protein KDA78_12995 [Planctomycetaceae bacterium]|nr:hypothetical protein [Planctomycetaceae bacterium]